MTLNDIIKYENALLLVEKRFENNELNLPFNVLIDLKKELKKIGEITNIYITELRRLSAIDGKDIEKERERMLLTPLDYDISALNKIMSCDEIINFYNIKKD